MYLRISYILLFWVMSITIFAETNPSAERTQKVLSGYIKDQASGEVLIGATVYVKELASGTATNVYGFYSFALDPGTYEITFAYLGFESSTRQVKVEKDLTYAVELKPISESIDEVTVVSKKPDENVTSTQMGVEKLQSKTIKSVPALMGEVDPIKVIQLLPGVKATSEGSSGFSVRGGGPDQNLVLLDEAIVYNAGHLMGFFSVFNNDAIKDLKLYKGDIPASNGGRLASLLDIRMKEGNNQKFSGNGGVGLISSRLTLEGPVFNEKTSFLVSGRRSYFDMFFPFSSDETLKKTTFYMYDFNAKVNHTFNENNRLYISGYLGRDVMGPPDFLFDYGNQTFTTRWNHIFSPRLFSNFSFIQSNYDYAMGTGGEGNTGFRLDSRLTDFSLKADFNFYLNNKNTINFGFQSIQHRVNPGVFKGVGKDALFNKVELPISRSLENALYVSNDQKVTSTLSVRYGLRLSSLHNISKDTIYTYDKNHNYESGKVYDEGDVFNSYYNLEPRVAATLMLNRSSSIKGSYSRTVQYIQMASNSTSGSPLDIWFPASLNIKPQLSDQVALGYFRNFDNNTIETSMEVFYKDLQNVIDYKDHAELIGNKHIEGEMRIGSGYAYGLELMMKFNKEKFNGWVSYTYSRAYREIPEILDGKRYHSPYDRPNDISIVLNHKIGKRGSISANWVYTTGTPMTAPTGRMEIGGSVVPVYSSRNQVRMPDYHRLDIGYTLQSKKNKNRRWQGEWNFSIYNIYGRHNAWMIGFEQDEDNPLQTKSTRTYLFGIIPSVSYNFKF